jgi:hypothetical protein
MAIPQVTPSASRPKRRRRKHRHAWKDRHYRWVPDGDCGWRVQGYIVRHKHRPPKHHHRGPGPRPADRCLPAAPANRDPRPPGTYQGPFGTEQARRLLARAGFGAVPGQAEHLATLGLLGAVQSLTRPAGPATLQGPAPVDDEGDPIAPADSWGHDHLWFLDRMVRSDQPLVERMTLVLHDWFATSNAGVSKQQQMIDQSNLFRASCFGSFLDLFRAVTVDPAMLQWLNGAESTKEAPNENYGREMMELFSLGADRGAYTEDDIREQARALTGWTYDWSNELGAHNFRFEPELHDYGTKTVFGRTGNWSWEDAARLCVENPFHPSFFVEKLWSYFIAQPPDDATRDSLIDVYRGSGWEIRPVLEAILARPELYEGPPMVKPPVVQLAGMLRSVGRFIDTDSWTWLCEEAGQLLFWPPNVSGWDDTRWLDTSRMRARWNTVDYVLEGISVNAWSDPYSSTETPEEALARALGAWGSPTLRDEHRAELLDFGRRAEKQAIADWQQGPYRALRQNALLQLIGISPDMVLQ